MSFSANMPNRASGSSIPDRRASPTLMYPFSKLPSTPKALWPPEAPAVVWPVVLARGSARPLIGCAGVLVRGVAGACVGGVAGVRVGRVTLLRGLGGGAAGPTSIAWSPVTTLGGPAALLIVSVTGYVPASVYVCVVVRPSPVVWSPNSHSHFVGVSLEVSVNSTVRGAFPDVTSTLKLASGAAAPPVGSRGPQLDRGEGPAHLLQQIGGHLERRASARGPRASRPVPTTRALRPVPAARALGRCPRPRPWAQRPPSPGALRPV